ncbi:hypothetical protein BST61_g657 [Cercospora zeina]
MDRASQALAESACNSNSRSFRARSNRSHVPRTTLQHRARGRPSIEEKAQSQQYLDPWEERALVNFLTDQDALGRPVRIKYVGSIAFSLAKRRLPAQRPSKPPSKNWPQLFYRRHPELKARTASALDWNRFNIYDKVVQWFDVIAKVLDDPVVLQENVYNMDETGVMLCKLNSIKVLVGKDNQRGYRGARMKRTTITAVECVSGDGRCLNPMIIWPASTHRSNWSTHPTPGWHYAFSDSGYTDAYLSLQWLKLVFDPQTKERAMQKPRILICDGFATHETLEVLEFCFENNIVLCRLPSHTSHKLQPCDISVFGPLKSAYRDQVERLERGGVGTIGKEHFTSLYSPASKCALTPRNIRAGWSKAGVFPFNATKVIQNIPQPLADVTVQKHCVDSPIQDSIPHTPITPVSSEAVASLRTLIQQDAHQQDETSKQRLRKCLQKLINATQLSFAERALLQEQNLFLNQVNSEAKVRRSTKSEIIGTARVMSFEDLERARAARSVKDADTAAKKARNAARKLAKGVVDTARAGPGDESHILTQDVPAPEPNIARNTQQECRSKGQAASVQDDGFMESGAAAIWRLDIQMGKSETMPEPYKAPVARMW